MLREEVIQTWTGLKGKINDLKLSEKDKQIANYLNNCPLLSFIASTVKDDELNDWENKAKEIQEKLGSFNPENEIIFDWYFLATQYISTVLNWIGLKKIYSQWRKDIVELENWKRTSHFLLFKANKAIITGMLNMIPVKEAENPQRAKESFEFMKEVREQLKQIDFIDEVYQEHDIEEVD